MSFRANLLANFINKGFSGFLSLLCIPFYLKFLGVEAYGLISFYLLLINMITLFDFANVPVNREIARLSVDQNNQLGVFFRSIELIYYAIAVFLGIGIFFLTPFIIHNWICVDTLSTSVVKQTFYLIAIALMFHWPYSLYSSGLMGLQKQVLLAGISIGITALRTLGTILVLVLDSSIQSFFTWQIAVNIVQLIIAAYYLRKNIPVSKPVSINFKFSNFWSFTSRMSLINLLSFVLLNLDKIILSKMLSLTSFGYYSLATNIVCGLYFIISPIFSAAFPRFSQLISMQNEAALTDFYHLTCQIMSIFVIPLALVLSLFSSEILLFWVKDPTIVDSTKGILSFLSIGTAFNGLMNLPYALQLAHGWTKLVIYQNIISIIVLVPLLFWAIYYFGNIGASYIWLLHNAACVLFTVPLLHKKYLQKEKWKWYLQDVGLPLLGSIGPILLGRWLFPQSVNLILYLTLIIVAAIAISILLTPISYKRFKEMVYV